MRGQGRAGAGSNEGQTASRIGGSLGGRAVGRVRLALRDAHDGAGRSRRGGGPCGRAGRCGRRRAPPPPISSARSYSAPPCVARGRGGTGTRCWSGLGPVCAGDEPGPDRFGRAAAPERAGRGLRARYGGPAPHSSSRQDGFSSLMIASQNGHLDIVKALLESRADVNAENKVRNPSLPPPFFVPSTHRDTSVAFSLPAPTPHTRARSRRRCDSDGARWHTHGCALHRSLPGGLLYVYFAVSPFV